MTQGERWRTAFVLALAAHFFLFQPKWVGVDGGAVSGQAISVNLSPSSVRMSHESGVAVQFGQQQGDETSAIADMRRKVYNRYIADVDAEIHRRRFDTGRHDLIGVATFSFIVRGDGSFAEVTLFSSSGRPGLDAAAEYAVYSASGKIRRPPELGAEPIAMVIQVKYQYALR